MPEYPFGPEEIEERCERPGCEICDPAIAEGLMAREREPEPQRIRRFRRLRYALTYGSAPALRALFYALLAADAAIWLVRHV